MIRGRRLLLGLLQITTAREVAARCRVSPSCVSEWVNGIKKPSRASRAKLADLYGIAPEAWNSQLTSFAPGPH